MYEEKKYRCSICDREMDTMRFSDYLPFSIVCKECDEEKIKPIFCKNTLLQIFAKQDKNFKNAIA